MRYLTLGKRLEEGNEEGLQITPGELLGISVLRPK